MASRRKNSLSEIEADLDDENSMPGAVTVKNRESDEDTEDASETDMVKQEEEYTEIKEQVYQDKLSNLKHQKDQHEKRKHPEYLKKVKKLEEDHSERRLRNRAQRDRELDLVNKEYEEEMRAIDEYFEMKSREIKENLIADLKEKLRLLKSERESLELTGDSTEAKPPAPTRKLRPRANDPIPVVERRRKASPMRVNYLLEEDEINEDLKNMSLGGRTKASSGRRNELTESFCSENVMEVRVEDGKLYYDKKWFHRGQSIYYNFRDNNTKGSAVIYSINTNEIYIKKNQDSPKVKILITQLQKGRFVIARKNRCI